LHEAMCSRVTFVQFGTHKIILFSINHSYNFQTTLWNMLMSCLKTSRLFSSNDMQTKTRPMYLVEIKCKFIKVYQDFKIFSK
jgi:hypothetical protein